MAELRIEIQGLREAQRRLAAFPDLYRKGVRMGMEAATARLQHDLAEYPEQIRGRKAVFKTLKQRRYFFWALRNGIIQVPYRRTVTLGRRWTTKITESGNTITGKVGNNTRYARIVQGPAGEQSREMAARRWQGADKVLAKNRKAIEQDFRDAMDYIVRQLEGK